MTLVASNPLAFGDPTWGGTIHLNIGDATGKFHFKLACPNQKKHE